MNYFKPFAKTKILSAAFALVSLTFLTSCAIKSPRHDALPSLNQWQVKGRLAVRTEEQAFSGNLHWTKNKDKQEFNLFGPFGKLYAALKEDSNGAELYLDGKGKRLAVNADVLIKEALGVDLPLSFLFYWVQGRPIPKTPGEFKLDSRGRLESLKFRDWNVEYHNYQYYGSRMLPSKIRIERPGQLLKLSLRDWKI